MMRLLSMMVAAAMLVGLAGCPSQNQPNQPTPTTQQTHNAAIDNAALTIDTAAKELTAAKKAGLIVRGSDIDHKISLALHSADAALEAYHAGSATGESDFASAAQAFWAVFAEVEPAIIKGK